eukprot:11389220-Alexandrium_andersonii.AAC.1
MGRCAEEGPPCLGEVGVLEEPVHHCHQQGCLGQSLDQRTGRAAGHDCVLREDLGEPHCGWALGSP